MKVFYLELSEVFNTLYIVLLFLSSSFGDGLLKIKLEPILFFVNSI